MLYAAQDVEAAAGTPLIVEGSVFGPAPGLHIARRAKTITAGRFEREYRQQLRGSYRTDHASWVDLVEQAALADVTLVGDGEVTRVLYACLVAAGAARALALDPDEDELGITVIEARRAAVLEREGEARPTARELMAAAEPSIERKRYR